MIRFRPAAARELMADYDHYEHDRPGRGERFVAAVEVALTQIERAPEQAPLLVPPDIRSAKVLRFPYRVVYLTVGEAIEVLAVAHAKRRPGYWRRR